MAFPDLFKLEKLRIEAYQDENRSILVDKFEAMFNPETLARQYGVTYGVQRAVSGGTPAPRFEQTPPSSFNLKLLLDGSGVENTGLVGLLAPRPSVDDQIATFKRLCYDINGDSHEPNFLKVKWGKLDISCRLTTLKVNYTSFERDGSTVRAELDVDFVVAVPAEQQLRAMRLASPDVSHSRVVREGDTLPLLTKEVYGSSRYYLAVARINGVDHFRSLASGRELLFPPLAR
jgi:hypothetical protein